MTDVSKKRKKNKLLNKISYLRFVEAAVGYEIQKKNKLFRMISCSRDINHPKHIWVGRKRGWVRGSRVSHCLI